MTKSISDEKAYENTDVELWREPTKTEGMSYYANSIHRTEGGGIGINVGGTVYVKTLKEWHDLAGGTTNLNEPAPHKEWLKPSEIAERNLILNSKGKGDYRYILRLIKSGKLPARNWAEQGEKPYWLVSYFEIMKYNEMLRQGVI